MEKRVRAVIVRRLALAGLVVFAVTVPNLLWLARSTVRVENRSAAAPADVTIEACSTVIPLGTLLPGTSRFRILPVCGDDTLVVRAEGIPICTTYVEGAMYHVRAWFDGPATGGCAYGSPPLTPLLVGELF